jgi:predicted helicase
MSAVNEFAEAVKAAFSTGHALEHAYRPALKQLLDQMGDVHAVNDPKRSEYGNPDFILLKESNRNIILGYAEAKDITVSLEKTIKTEQLRRYAGYEKLFLTNCLDFRFFRNGELNESISIGKITNNQIVFDTRAFVRLEHELQAFLELPPESIRSGKRLALIMGGKARRIRDNVAHYLQVQGNEKNQELEKIFKMMKILLVHDLTPDKFADMYAQTLVYGLFVARYNDKTPDDFNRSEARDLVPASNPFLREFFDHIVGPRFDSRLAHIVDELCEVFSASDVHRIIQKHLRLFEVENDKDPIIHFYEDFLKEYDPVERKKMGAYYTPVPVVRFIIRQVDEILKREFGLAKGLADTSKITKEFNVGQKVNVRNQETGRMERTDVIQREFHRVQVLDPAVGTATFLNEAIKYIHKSFEGQEGRWPKYAEEALLPRLHGFELMMAPYTIAHLKLGMTLQETGVEDFRQRLGVYLTNTLEEGIKQQQGFNFGLADVVSHEAQEAASIKRDKPIMIITGNPPYSGVSSNDTVYANGLVSKYRVEPGGNQRLNEQKQWLRNDYVKFIAYAEDMIIKNGEGVMAMITDHSYLEGPTFRGMRWHLTSTFDKIYILDLHGNSKKQEVAPDGSIDENVFDIMQGVAIILAVKNGHSTKDAAVYHADVYGTRKSKFAELDKNIEWKKLELDAKQYFFDNKNIDGKAQYEEGTLITDLFLQKSLGFMTGRDKFATDHSREVLQDRISKFYDRSLSAEEAKEAYNINDFRRFVIAKFKSLYEYEPIKIKPFLARPFDFRYVYYQQYLVQEWQNRIMKHSAHKDNISLVVGRQSIAAGGPSWDVVFIANTMIDLNIFRRGGGVAFPLYLYHDDGTRTPNFDQKELKIFTQNITEPYENEDIVSYIYAVFHSPNYRESYKEFLKSDFPRIPVPKNDDEFNRLVAFGKQLRELHLMVSPDLNELITVYPEAGNNEIEKVSYSDGKVWINSTQYFGNVPEVAWNFYIGGYQPAQKWLKDRKGRNLSNQDIEHYQKIVKILGETDRLMQKVDKVWQ